MWKFNIFSKILIKIVCMDEDWTEKINTRIFLLIFRITKIVFPKIFSENSRMKKKTKHLKMSKISGLALLKSYSWLQNFGIFIEKLDH